MRLFLDLHRIQRIAVSTPDIAPGKTYKYLSLSDPGTLSLNRIEYLVKLGMFHAYNHTEHRTELQELHSENCCRNEKKASKALDKNVQIILGNTNNPINFLTIVVK